MGFRIHPFNTQGEYFCVDILAIYKGKWIFCMHQERNTWEYSGGHIEAGETPLEAAKRELFEETGAVDFDIEPLCDYYIDAEVNGIHYKGSGQAYFAVVHQLDELPHYSEMRQIAFLDALPNELTYPFTRDFFPMAEEKRRTKINEENFAIPGAGAIILKEINGKENILLQTRIRPHIPCEDGLLEIPAGKIRAFENIFDTLKREIKEETGLDVSEILGENLSTIYEENSYKVINFMPFSCAQNLSGNYPIMVFVFICKVKGTLLPFSDESSNYKWTPVAEVKRLLSDAPDIFYPMHVDTLKKYITLSNP